jgi:hypothetical protein
VVLPQRLGDILSKPDRSPPRAVRSKARYAVLALSTACLSIAAGILAFFAADIYLHHKYERTASVNVWGYRGPPVGRKQPGETRVAVFGGSTAFGYGPDWDGSFPYLLEGRLNERSSRPGSFSVVNLAYNNDGAYAFRLAMEDYAYLEFDVAILYEGYNDLGDAPHHDTYRHHSPLFRLTGYMPILPLILREKAHAIAYGGDISRGYRGEQTVFRPTLAARAASGTLTAAAETAQALERQLGKLTPESQRSNPAASETTCEDRWKDYCGSIADAIAWARSRGIAVIVGTQPYISDRHVAQQQALTVFLRERAASDSGIVHVNLGTAIDLKNSGLAYDGMHLTRDGNAVIAEAFVAPVLAIRHERQH